jgi:hypothetical protein
MRTSRIYRKADKIETDATKDYEKVTTFQSKGNSFTMEYNNQKLKGSSHENKTSKFKVDSPISGFSKILTCKSLSISPAAGSFPSGSAPQISSSGVAKFGNPCSGAGLALGMPTITALTTISTLVDTLAIMHCLPPILSANIGKMSKKLSSKLAFG